MLHIYGRFVYLAFPNLQFLLCLCWNTFNLLTQGPGSLLVAGVAPAHHRGLPADGGLAPVVEAGQRGVTGQGQAGELGQHGADHLARQPHQGDVILYVATDLLKIFMDNNVILADSEVLKMEFV